MRKVVGVFGSAQGRMDSETVRKARGIGHAIAGNGCVLVSGACTGLPYEAGRAAKEKGGIVIGFSPAGSEREHRERYGYPVDGFDFISYTGCGYKGRNVITVRSCDAAVFISGGIGTLNEFTIAYDEGKSIGILTGTGGITGIVKDVVKKAVRQTAASVVYDSDPEKLVGKLLRG